MPTQFCEYLAYVQLPDTATLLAAIRTQFDRDRAEGGAELPGWTVSVLVGQDGWHLLRSSPWNLLVRQGRFLQLLEALHAPGFLVMAEDNLGQVIVEVAPDGRRTATGMWHEDTSAPPAPDDVWDDFYGLPLEPVGLAEPQGPLLGQLWRESLRPIGEEYDDCQGNSELEVFCKYVGRRLLGRPVWQISDTRAWLPEFSHVLRWGRAAEPTPPGPARVQDGRGAWLVEGDVVLLDEGLASGRVAGVLVLQDVMLVMVDTGAPGKTAAHAHDGVAPTLWSTEQRAASTEACAVAFLEARATAGDTAAMFALSVRCKRGLGVPVDAARADHWIRLAASHGHPGAQAIVARLDSAPAE